ncbi:MAG: hypothetical protein KGI06_05100 [Candidatus Micrarchaeota archaeon]|nr:hypothetical protein [Candidatus Micrarchaeota archaeon]
MHQDERGSITTLDYNTGMRPREYTIIYTREGFSRGGDLHPTKQHAVLLEGKATWTEKLEGNGFNTSAHRLYTDFVINERIPHFFTAEKDSVIVTWLEGDFKQYLDDGLRDYIASRNASVRSNGHVPASMKVQDDGKGSVTTLTYNEEQGLKEYRIAYTNEGFSRGGHSHPERQHVVLLDGEVAWTAQKSATNLQIETFSQLPCKIVEIPEWVPHFYRAKRPSLMISWQEGMKFEEYADGYMKSLMRK